MYTEQRSFRKDDTIDSIDMTRIRDFKSLEVEERKTLMIYWIKLLRI